MTYQAIDKGIGQWRAEGGQMGSRPQASMAGGIQRVR